MNLNPEWRSIYFEASITVQGLHKPSSFRGYYHIPLLLEKLRHTAEHNTKTAIEKRKGVVHWLPEQLNMMALTGLAS